MPFELKHVNVYLLRDGDGFTLIDTGLQTNESRQALNQKLVPNLPDEPVQTAA